MNAKAQALTPAAINRALDRINNPILSEEDATFVREARARIKELDALVLSAIDKRQWTTADKLDSQRSKLWRAIDVREGRKPRSANPTSKTRAVRVVAANPVKTAIKTVRRKSLVGGNYWAVLFYANKDKPSGKPDITYPAPSKESARHFVTSLEKAGASGVAILEFTKARVS